MTTGRCLVLSSSPVLEGSVLETHLRSISNSLASVSLVTNSSYLGKDSLPVEVYDTAVSISDRPGFHSTHFLASIYSALKPNGKLYVSEPASQVEDLAKQVILAGFSGCSTQLSQSTCEVEAQKPSWEQGSKAAISLKPKVASLAVKPVKAWSLAADDDEELLDDDELLMEEDKAVPPAPAADCGAKTSKKACKNCTCGRAEGEMQEEVKLTVDMLENPQSGCGSCGLGDAFRCAGCPYRGLPNFQMGKKIELPSDFLTADA